MMKRKLLFKEKVFVYDGVWFQVITRLNAERKLSISDVILSRFTHHNLLNLSSNIGVGKIEIYQIQHKFKAQ